VGNLEKVVKREKGVTFSTDYFKGCNTIYYKEVLKTG